MSGFDLQALEAYTNEHDIAEFVRESFERGDTIPRIRVQEGVKSVSAIPLMLDDMEIQADGCKLTPSGGTKLEQAKIEVCPLAVEEEYCVRDLEEFFTNTRLPAGSHYENIPFEEQIIDLKVNSLAAKIERLVWQGNTDASDIGFLEECDGFIVDIAGNEDRIKADSATMTTNANVNTAVNAVVAATPTKIIDRNDLILFISKANFRKYVAYWRETEGSMPFDTSNLQNWELVIPGTNVTLTGVNGLAGIDTIYLTHAMNLVYGTDLRNDQERFEFFYDRKSDTVTLRAKWKGGVKAIFGDEIVTNEAA